MVSLTHAAALVQVRDAAADGDKGTMGISKRLSPLISGLADLKICALVSTSIGEDKRSVQMRPMI